MSPWGRAKAVADAWERTWTGPSHWPESREVPVAKRDPVDYEGLCSCGGPLYIHEWTAEDGHRHRSTHCPAEYMLTTVDMDLAIRVLNG